MPTSAHAIELNKDYSNVLAQPDIKESELNVLFRDSPIGTAFCALDGTFMRANNAYCALVGYASAELEGVRTFGSITHPDDQDTDTLMAKELIEGKRTFYQMQKRYITKFGKTVWVDLTVNKVVNKDLIVVHLVGVAIPIVVGDEYLKLKQDKDGNMSLRPFVPLGDFLYAHRKWLIAATISLSGIVGGAVHTYYKAVADAEMQTTRIVEILKMAEERKKTIDDQNKQLNDISRELFQLRTKVLKNAE